MDREHASEDPVYKAIPRGYKADDAAIPLGSAFHVAYGRRAAYSRPFNDDYRFNDGTINPRPFPSPKVRAMLAELSQRYEDKVRLTELIGVVVSAAAIISLLCYCLMRP